MAAGTSAPKVGRMESVGAATSMGNARAMGVGANAPRVVLGMGGDGKGDILHGSHAQLGDGGSHFGRDLKMFGVAGHSKCKCES